MSQPERSNDETRPTMTKRGYGSVHQTLRKRFAPKVAAGQVWQTDSPWRTLGSRPTSTALDQVPRPQTSSQQPGHNGEAESERRLRSLVLPGRPPGLRGIGRRLPSRETNGWRCPRRSASTAAAKPRGCGDGWRSDPALAGCKPDPEVCHHLRSQRKTAQEGEGFEPRLLSSWGA